MAGMASLVMLVSFLISGFDFKPQPDSVLEVFYPDPLVELHLQDATVEEAIARLETRYNVRVEMETVVPGTVTCAFSRMPLSHVLEVLAGNHQYRIEQDGPVYRIIPRGDLPAGTITAKKASPRPAVIEEPAIPEPQPEAPAVAVAVDPLEEIQAIWKKGQRKEAIQALEAVLQKPSPDARALVMLGEFHKAERHLRSALNCWDRAIALQGENAELTSARDELEILIGYVEAERDRYPEGKARKKLEVYLR